MSRPPSQRWIKRPPRPSRAGNAAPPPRQKPRGHHLAIAVAVGAGGGLIGSALGVTLGAREGIPGLLAGIGICLGTLLTWRGFGFTLQDFRDFWR